MKIKEGQQVKDTNMFVVKKMEEKESGEIGGWKRKRICWVEEIKIGEGMIWGGKWVKTEDYDGSGRGKMGKKVLGRMGMNEEQIEAEVENEENDILIKGEKIMT